MTIYELKPKFQAILRPVTRALARYGVTANQVTVSAAAISLALGILLAAAHQQRILFLLLPLWLFLRMALNAIDGMLAREFGQKSSLGAYLNELCDVVSDAALYLPFALLTPFSPLSVSIFIFAAALTEYAGVLGLMVGASRRYDGPFGKSDRAFALGALGLWIGFGMPLPDWSAWLFPIFATACVATVVNRIRAGLAEARSSSSSL